MTVKDKVQRAAAAAVLSRLIKYVRKDPDTNLVKLVDRSERFVGNIFPAKNFDSFREGAKDPENVWRQLALKLIDEIDDNVLMNMMLALGLGAGVNGTKTGSRKPRKISLQYSVGHSPRPDKRVQPQVQGMLERGIRPQAEPHF